MTRLFPLLAPAIYLTLGAGCAPPSAVAAAANVGPTPWQRATVFPHQSCDGETYDVCLGADGTSLTDGCARYDLTTGARSGVAPEVQQWVGSSNVLFARSRDRARELTIRPLDESSETVRVRDLSRERLLCARRFLNPLHPHAAAALPDGRFAIYGEDRCGPATRDEGGARTFACEERGLFAVDDHCALEPLAVGPDFIGAVVSSEGTRGVLVDRHGRVHVVALPSGAALATVDAPVLDPAIDLGQPQLAATAGAGTFALAWRGTLSVFTRDEAGPYRPALVQSLGKDRSPLGVYFTPDAASLVVDDLDSIEVFRPAPRR